MGRVIAIDGPSGAGKSTISKLVAERLGFQFLDTGALYRATALHLRRKGLKEDSSDEEIANALKGVEIVFIDGKVFLKDASCITHHASRSYGEDVSEAIRTTEAGHYASVFSARKAVRDFLLDLQRDAAVHNDIVAEGRDMTTVVFPNAWKKFFLNASEEGRAKRRCLQLKEKGMDITMEEALKDVRERDIRDRSRDIAPLKRTDDAIYIDTTDMSLNAVVDKVLENLA
jgi:cytidylate kinase